MSNTNFNPQPGWMFNKLHEAESVMPMLLGNINDWNSVYVDYEPPIVERLWIPFAGRYRVFLHTIHPCAPGEPLFHAHPWPSAVRILSGRYEMVVGQAKLGEETKGHQTGTTIILTAGSEYEIISPTDGHSVRPIDEVSRSIMVTDKPWNPNGPKQNKKKQLRPLTEEEKWNNYQFYLGYYNMVKVQ